jgi:hypothetical protein
VATTEPEAAPPPTLLDENLDPALAGPLAAVLGPAAAVSSVRARGWLGTRNGPLVEAMAEAGLRVLVTGDVRLWRERRRLLQQHRIGVVLVQEPAEAGARVGAIAQAVRQVAPGELITVPA